MLAYVDNNQSYIWIFTLFKVKEGLETALLFLAEQQMKNIKRSKLFCPVPFDCNRKEHTTCRFTYQEGVSLVSG